MIATQSLTTKAPAAARLCLLLLAALLFTTVWESDTRHQNEVLAMRKANSPTYFVAAPSKKSKIARAHQSHRQTRPSAVVHRA